MRIQVLPNALNPSAEDVKLQPRDSTVGAKERQWKSRPTKL
jgi:hypothetical protein